MQITVACGAMSFGPETPNLASLGGSETAALMLSKAIAARGHDVTLFCNLPPQGRPDYFPSGTKHSDGVRYVDLAKHFKDFICVNPCDVLIAVRDPGLLTLPSQAKKKVLWAHDIFTKRGMQRALDQMSFCFDEIWAVSEWHKNQICETTGYPAERVVALRNGIAKHDDVIPFGRVANQLVYASRPERGLENLVKEGGVMEHLPDFKLVVAMYAHYPEHMKAFYEYIFSRMRALPNVEFVGGKPNGELRQIIADSAAYIYPTQFEETSCILARECIERGTPFFTTSVGALPETLGNEGIYFEQYLHSMGVTEPERGSPGWCQLFAMFVRDGLKRESGLVALSEQMARRTDLYWDGVAEIVEPHLKPQEGTAFSRLWSLLQDGDVIPAIAYYRSLEEDTMLTGQIAEELQLYDFVNGDVGKYYDDFYRAKSVGANNELNFITHIPGARHAAIADQIATLPPGSTIFEYGCGPGHVIAPLAKIFPQHTFVGFDFAQSAVDVINDGAREHNLPNLSASTDLPDPGLEGEDPYFFDAVICSEVLEHVVEPWKLLQEVEAFSKVGGLMICTTPFGAWEPRSYEEGLARWKERFHLWEIDRRMFVEMIGEKKDFSTQMVVIQATTEWMRPVGNYLFTYRADHRPIRAVDPLDKATRHWARETCAAVVIAYNNEDTIVRLLNSLDKKVQFVQVALGPSTDGTYNLMIEWFEQHPWMRYNIIDVPKIEPYVFGFDDARNASTKDVGRDCEWMIWIDTDEYLSGEPRKYYRPSALDGYLVAQHHFTCEPRGNPPEIDKPARLIRTDRGFAAKGHIHEHFEIPAGGPGRCMLLPDVDIGHVGYANEEVRRARFFRNFPFLMWEHEEDGGERPLHKFLYLRDLIHQMRFAQDPAEKAKFAREALEWYNSNLEAMSAFGPGLPMSLAYTAEANAFLGRGVPMKIQIAFDDRSATLEGRFDDYEQVVRVLKQMVGGEIADRTNRYY
jgi:glycosyltransferase involved in cell wall biosynthesis/SAM-dependent methyltransferase